jgi:hypothetical protein
MIIPAKIRTSANVLILLILLLYFTPINKRLLKENYIILWREENRRKGLLFLKVVIEAPK